MAYLAFQDLGCAVASHAVRATAAIGPVANVDGAETGAAPAAEALSPLEWSVVAIARTDPRRSVRAPGRMAVKLRRLFNGLNPMLGNPRLEALRRAAVLTWHDGDAVPAQEVRAFMDAGFTAGQHLTMVDRILATRTRDAR